jgi:hypothetical protein
MRAQFNFLTFFAILQFCGNPAIGADLKAMCRKHSKGEVAFSFYKEYF